MGLIWHPVKLQCAKFKNRKTHNKNSLNIQVLYITIQLIFLLIQPPCQISKRLYAESRPCDYLRTAPCIQTQENTISTSQVRLNIWNNDIIHALPLKIFLCWHAKMSQKHHKWSFCSQNFFFISPKCPFIWRVWFRNTPVSTRPCSINFFFISPKCPFIWHVWFRNTPVSTHPTCRQSI
jgi:hypothetical protein